MATKNCVPIGYNIRVSFNSEWQLVNSLNRCCAVRRLTDADKEFKRCVDCNNDAQYMVVELSRFTPRGNKNTQPLVWGWCGLCDIGEKITDK